MGRDIIGDPHRWSKLQIAKWKLKRKPGIENRKNKSQTPKEINWTVWFFI